MASAPRARAACGLEDLARVIELAEQELYPQLDAHSHPRYREVTALLEAGCDEEWELHREAARAAADELESMVLLPDEWTVEVAVGDHFLQRGLGLYAEALEMLPEQPEPGLDLLAEGLTNLLAVQAWKSTHDEN